MIFCSSCSGCYILILMVYALYRIKMARRSPISVSISVVVRHSQLCSYYLSRLNWRADYWRGQCFAPSSEKGRLSGMMFCLVVSQKEQLLVFIVF